MSKPARFLKSILGTAVIVGTNLLCSASAIAQDFPNRPIKIIVGFAAGGLTDVLPRLLAGPMSERLGQPVIIENKTGAAGNIATTFVANSAPDGYTLLASTVGQIVVSPHTSSMAINPVTDLVHISMVGEGDQIFSINPDVPAKNYAEFVSLVKKNPGKYFYGDAGAGGSMNLYIEYFKMLTGLSTSMDGVHYRGAAALMPDLLSNRVQMSLNTFPVIEGYLPQGKLRPILLIGKQRDARIPLVPTVAEVGLKEMEAASNWFGLHAPKGTPPAVVQKIHAALMDALKKESVKAGLVTMAIRPVGDTAQEFSARIAADYNTFGKVALDAKVKAE